MPEKIFIKAEVELASPLSISNGEESLSDKDVIRDFYGNPFVPGTSIAGPLRAHMDIFEAKKLFGSLESNSQSPLAVLDAYFTGPVKTSIRDGVELESNIKTAKDENKFDYEIVEGGKLTFRFELLERGKPLLPELLSLLEAVNRGEIRFGHKKNRGFGRLSITKIQYKKYAKGEAFYEFDWDFFDWENEDGKVSTIILKPDAELVKFDIMRIPLKLEGCISIRHYSSMASKADFAHITKNGNPVIPGTSWCGAIRHRALQILQELKVENPKGMIDGIFGSTDIKIGQSRVVVYESEIEGAIPLELTRNKINRFTGDTMDQALYTESTFAGGTCSLEMLIARDADTLWIKGLLYLVIHDLVNGFLAVGGETSVGRGLFSLAESSLEDGNSAIREFISVINTEALA
jgi:CRISPR/Cas system CSM-associated protein Csm3 (group 7 of RAMP superfamily)